MGNMLAAVGWVLVTASDSVVGAVLSTSFVDCASLHLDSRARGAALSVCAGDLAFIFGIMLYTFH